MPTPPPSTSSTPMRPAWAACLPGGTRSCRRHLDEPGDPLPGIFIPRARAHVRNPGDRSIKPLAALACPRRPMACSPCLRAPTRGAHWQDVHKLPRVFRASKRRYSAPGRRQWRPHRSRQLLARLALLRLQPWRRGSQRFPDLLRQCDLAEKRCSSTYPLRFLGKATGFREPRRVPPPSPLAASPTLCTMYPPARSTFAGRQPCAFR